MTYGRKTYLIGMSFIPIYMVVFVAGCTSKSNAVSKAKLEVVSEPDLTKRYSIGLAEPECVPGECVCSGEVSPEVRLNETGPRPEDLQEGVPCIAADFDGNGTIDYALPGAEGMANVILNDKEGLWRAIRIDASGVLELYTPRDLVGEHGEPKSKNYGLFVRWVGQNHAVFLWDGEGFTRTFFPGYYQQKNY